MFVGKIVNNCALLAAAVALSTGGLLVSPTAHAAANCTVDGEYFVIHQDNGVDIMVAANGSTLGPSAHSNRGNDQGPAGTLTGSITGRKIDFSVTWYTNQYGLLGDPGTAHFTGFIGDNLADGNSTGKPWQVKAEDGITTFWAASHWNSVGYPFICAADDTPATDPKALGDATVAVATDIYDKPDGKGQKIGSLAVGEVHPVMEPCRDDWCRVGRIELGGYDGLPNGTAWVYSKGFLTFSP
jgi:hypothetical protein